VTIHDGLHFFMWKDLSPLKQLYVRVVMGHGVRASDAVITVSEYARREIELHVRARGRRIEVIHNGIESDFGSGGERPVETTPYFLFVGNVKPHKNLKTALVAFRQFLTAHPEYRFCIAGKKDTFRINDDEIDAVVATIPSGAIQFLGEVSEEALKSLYRHASAFVYPSLYEGFGIPILEAMAFDIPIIASNTTSIPEVGGNAIEYFDPADASSVHAAMCRVTAPGFSVDRAQYAAQRERFSLERCVARHLEVLISLSAPAGPGPR
jgi:glycosyltransferase involved in cell wall biosynthesis